MERGRGAGMIYGSDVVTGRRGAYKCPFCKTEIRGTEDEMVEHRNEGSCAERRDRLRAGVLSGEPIPSAIITEEAWLRQAGFDEPDEPAPRKRGSKR